MQKKAISTYLKPAVFESYLALPQDTEYFRKCFFNCLYHDELKTNVSPPNDDSEISKTLNNSSVVEIIENEPSIVDVLDDSIDERDFIIQNPNPNPNRPTDPFFSLTYSDIMNVDNCVTSTQLYF